MLRVDVTVAQAEALLAAEYHHLEHTTGVSTHRTLSYSLPDDVAAVVDFVSPTVNIPSIASKMRMVAPPKTEYIENTPAQLRSLYSVNGTVGVSPKNSMAVTAFLDQYYKLSDLETYWSKFCDGTHSTHTYTQTHVRAHTHTHTHTHIHT
jgi:hypothetical protein